MYRATLCVIASAGLLAGCDTSSTTVIPLTNGGFQVVSTAVSETAALQGAIAEANARCAAQGQEAFVLSTESRYQGVDRNTALIVDSLASIAQGADSSVVASPGLDDYRVQITARCGPA